MQNKYWHKAVVKNKTMYNLFFRRVLAFFVDYSIIIGYALLLFLASTFLKNYFSIDLDMASPIKNQLLSFFLLTLPVFLYFYLSERGVRNATLGKRALKLKVGVNGNILLRNFLKFLPWEIAHIGVHQIVFYDQQQLEAPVWVWYLLIIPQVVILIYFISLLVTKGEGSVYDKIAQTKISLES